MTTQTYSVLIAWNDNDDEEGEFGWTGRAASSDEAERKARDAMRASYADQYGEECLELREHDEDEIGGRVIDLQVGAMWHASELEASLRAILPYAESRAEDMEETADECEMKRLDTAPQAREAHAKAVAAVDAAKALLASLDGSTDAEGAANG